MKPLLIITICILAYAALAMVTSTDVLPGLYTPRKRD